MDCAYSMGVRRSSSGHASSYVKVGPRGYPLLRNASDRDSCCYGCTVGVKARIMFAHPPKTGGSAVECAVKDLTGQCYSFYCIECSERSLGRTMAPYELHMETDRDVLHLHYCTVRPDSDHSVNLVSCVTLSRLRRGIEAVQ